MAKNYKNMRDFITLLEKRGELVRVTHPVSTVLEMTEIQTRVLAERGPAILFENVIKADGSKSEMPVLVNLFGSVARVAAGMGRVPEELRDVGKTLAFLRQPPAESTGMDDSVARLKQLQARYDYLLQQRGAP